MFVGRLKNANSRGFGFIETEKKIDFFFHHSQYKGEWKDLLQKHVSGYVIVLEFENDLEANDGPRAINVRIKEVIKD